MRLVVRFIALVSLVAIVLIPLYFASAQPEASPVRVLPGIVHPGDTFNVTINFTSPNDTFAIPVITDFAPSGWTVEVQEDWCSPPPKNVLATNNATDNKIEVLWETQVYPQGTNFTAVYKVTVPNNASRGNNNFSGELYYHCDPAHPQETVAETIGGDSYVYVPLPEISFSPGYISFTALRGGDNPEDKELEIWNSGEETLDWTLNCSAFWLGVNSTEGNSTGEHNVIAVSANITGMSAGDYSATINITALAANNSPQVVPVTLHIGSPGGGGGGGTGPSMWLKDATPDMDDWFVAPGFNAYDYAVDDADSVIYVVGDLWMDNDSDGEVDQDGDYLLLTEEDGGGGGDGGGGEVTPRLLKSVDGGATWKDISKAVNDSLKAVPGQHFSYSQVAVAPDNPDFVAVCVGHI